MYLTQGDIMKEMTRFSRRELEDDKKEKVIWFWYRDVILQAQERGLVKVIGDSPELPFYQRKFSESIQVISDECRKMIIELGGKVMEKDVVV